MEHTNFTCTLFTMHSLDELEQWGFVPETYTDKKILQDYFISNIPLALNIKNNIMYNKKYIRIANVSRLKNYLREA